MTGPAAEAARARLDAALTGAALEARWFQQFVAAALHTIAQSGPMAAPAARASRRPGRGRGRWQRQQAGRHDSQNTKAPHQVSPWPDCTTTPAGGSKPAGWAQRRNPGRQSPSVVAQPAHP